MKVPEGLLLIASNFEQGFKSTIVWAIFQEERAHRISKTIFVLSSYEI